MHARAQRAGSDNVVEGVLRGETRESNHQDVVPRAGSALPNGQHLRGRKGAYYGVVVEANCEWWIPSGEVGVVIIGAGRKKIVLRDVCETLAICSRDMCTVSPILVLRNTIDWVSAQNTCFVCCWRIPLDSCSPQTAPKL